MEVINQTDYPHLLFRTTIDKQKIAAALMVRVTYDLDGSRAIPSRKQIWPLNTAAWQTAYGPMQGDYVYRRGGVDLFVFGSARAAHGQAVKRMEVRILLPGKIDHSILVLGDRIWESGIFGLGFSDPKPFTEMPLTLANGFGGTDEWDGLQVPSPNNSYGKGFIWQKAHAAGKPLPNIEDPKNLVAKWNDKPVPVGVVPIALCENRIRRSVSFNHMGQVVKLDPLFFNTAFNDMIAGEVVPGETITIIGVREKGTFQCTIPDHSFNLQLQFGNKTHERKLEIDQVGIETDHNRAFITYRYAFNYTMHPGEKRILTLTENR